MFEEAPRGTKDLAPIIEAMTRGRVLHISYCKFSTAEIKEWDVESYGLKQSKRRWYLLGRIEGHEGLTVLALDRIVAPVVTDRTYEADSGLDISGYFDEVVGVNLDDDYDCE